MVFSCKKARSRPLVLAALRCLLLLLLLAVGAAAWGLPSRDMQSTMCGPFERESGPQDEVWGVVRRACCGLWGGWHRVLHLYRRSSATLLALQHEDLYCCTRESGSIFPPSKLKFGASCPEPKRGRRSNSAPICSALAAGWRKNVPGAQVRRSNSPKPIHSIHPGPDA